MGGRAGSIAAVGSNQRDAQGLQLPIERIAIIGFVANEEHGQGHGEAAPQQRGHEARLVRLRPPRTERDRQPPAVGDHHDLTALAPLGFPDFRPPFLAATETAINETFREVKLPLPF